MICGGINMIDATTMTNIVNALQIIISALSVLYLLAESRRVEEKKILYFMAGGMFCQFLGNMFWTLYLLIRKVSYVTYTSAADAAWLGSFLFIITVHLFCRNNINHLRKHPLWMHVFPVFILLNTIKWIITGGEIFLNSMWEIVLCMLAWYNMEGFWLLKTEKKLHIWKPFYISVLLFLIIDIILFSCDGMMYSIVNLCLTVPYILMPIALVKGAKKPASGSAEKSA